jgi:hypothetical protein
MTVSELERRVKTLERQVKELQQQRAAPNGSPSFDWEATVAKFKNDEHVLAVLEEAMKLREKERRAIRRRSPKKRRASSRTAPGPEGRQ